MRAHAQATATRLLKRVTRRRRDTGRLARAQVVVLSFPKSGRTWLRTLLSRLYQQRHGLPDRVLLDFDNLHALDPAVPRVLFSHEAELLGEGAAADPARIAGKRVVLLVRDPIDVGVSRYFHILHRSRDDRKWHVCRMSVAEFLRTSEHGLPAIVAQMNQWWQQVRGLPDGRVVAYEDFRAEPAGNLRALVDFLGGGFSEGEIADAVAFASFENLAKLEAEGYFADGRLRPGDLARRDSFKVRRGKVGGYRDYLSPEEAEQLRGFVRAHLAPPLVERLGREAP